MMHRLALATAGALLCSASAFAQMTTPTVTDPSNPANVANTPTSDVANQPEQGTPIQRPGPASANDTMDGTNAGTIAPTAGTTTAGTMPGSSATGSTTTGADTAAAPTDPDTINTNPSAQTTKRAGKPKPQRNR